MTLRLVARPNGLLIPVSDLNLKDLPSRDLIVGDDLPLVLANLLGFDGNQPRLLKTDAAGNLRVSTVGSSNNGAVIPILDQLIGRPLSSMAGAGDAGNQLLTLAVMPYVFDGANTHYQRMASAVNVAAQGGFGVAMAAQPGEWGVQNSPAIGATSTITKPAGAAGVRHVARSVAAVVSSQVALGAAVNIALNLRDGASGAGTVLWAIELALPAAIIAPFAILLSGLNIVGAAATAMTLEFSGGSANLCESTSLTGYDAA